MTKFDTKQIPYVCKFYSFPKASKIAEKAIEKLTENAFVYKDNPEMKEYAFALTALHLAFQQTDKNKMRIYREMRAQVVMAIKAKKKEATE